jgi:hypothetical protein
MLPDAGGTASSSTSSGSAGGTGGGSAGTGGAGGLRIGRAKGRLRVSDGRRRGAGHGGDGRGRRGGGVRHAASPACSRRASRVTERGRSR